MKAFLLIFLLPVLYPIASQGQSGCGGVRRALSISANDQGMWITPQNYTVHPGDTLIVNSKYRWSYLSGDGLHGTQSCPIVVMNDGGQVEMTAGISFTNSTYLHVTGTGSPQNFYGFYIHSYGTVSPPSRGVALQFSDRSAHCEVDHVDEYLKTYCLWLKEEAQCADSLKVTGWRLNDFKVHDIRAKNINQDGFYVGSTAPGGGRAITCNGVTIAPIPMRLSNIKLYNIILDSVGRSGIQMSGADSGSNEIYNCRVTRTGFELNQTQGSGIILGGYTTAYVHDNYVRNTFQHGIFCIGAGLMRVENNNIDSSGYLAGSVNPDYSSISADTRETTNLGATPNGIYSTIYVRNNKVGVSTNRTGTTTAYRSIDIGYGYYNLPTWNNNNIICGNVLQDGKTPAEIRINQNIGYTKDCSGVPLSSAAIPGKIEAEAYSAMSGVQAQTTSDAGGGQNVGYIDNGDWMDYSVNVAAAGSYTAGFRIATPNSGASFQVLSSTGAVLATVGLPNTGGYQTWQTVTATVTLPAGSQVLRLKSTAAATWNINWMQFDVKTSQTALPIPGRVQAEAYSAMSGVKTQNTSDVGAGLNVGYIYNGYWMDYNVNVATAGKYTAGFRVATGNTGGSFQLLSSSGAVLATVSVPNTGGFQAWTTVTASVTLPAGNQVLRVKSTSSASWNINWIDFSTWAAIPGKIEAESYSAMSNVSTQATTDAGGGSNVGWIDKSDYMDYGVYVANAGQYTASFRIATPNSGTSAQLLSSSGAVLATINFPNTGGFQTWQTVTVSVNFPAAGNQMLRLKSTSNGQWNINWLQFASGGQSSASTPSSLAEGRSMSMDSVETLNAGTLNMYPNPARDRFTIQVNNSQTGLMRVQLVDVAGVVRQTVDCQKTGVQYQVDINTSSLATGIYFVRLQIGSWTAVRKLSKL